MTPESIVWARLCQDGGTPLLTPLLQLVSLDSVWGSTSRMVHEQLAIYCWLSAESSPGTVSHTQASAPLPVVPPQGSLGFLTAWHLGSKNDCSREAEVAHLVGPGPRSWHSVISAMFHCSEWSQSPPRLWGGGEGRHVDPFLSMAGVSQEFAATFSHHIFTDSSSPVTLL